MPPPKLLHSTFEDHRVDQVHHEAAVGAVVEVLEEVVLGVVVEAGSGWEG